MVMGLVSTNREDLYDRLKFLQNGGNSYLTEQLTTLVRLVLPLGYSCVYLIGFVFPVLLRWFSTGWRAIAV